MTMKTYLSRSTAVLLAFSVTASSSKPSEDTANAASMTVSRSVSVARVEMRPLGGTLTASGLLIPYEEAAVGSQLSGFRIATVMVDEGALVRAGQPLVQLDPTLIEAKIAQARAQLAQARAQASQAQTEADRVQGLGCVCARPGDDHTGRNTWRGRCQHRQVQ
jgi:HlyD family secretion protein